MKSFTEFQEGVGAALLGGALATGLAVKGIQTAKKVHSNLTSGKGKIGAARQRTSDELNKLNQSYEPECNSIDVKNEAYGGKRTSRKARLASIHPPTAKAAIKDIPVDNAQGSGNKARRRAGEDVEAKSPTYLAHVHNKKKKQKVNEEIEGGVSVETYTNGIQFTEIETVDIIEPTRLAPSPKAAEYFDWRVELDK